MSLASFSLGYMSKKQEPSQIQTTTLLVQFLCIYCCVFLHHGCTSVGEFLVFSYLIGIGLFDLSAINDGNPRVQLVKIGAFSS